MNVIIYARYSSHNQTEQSIEGQLKECYAFAKRNNFTVIGEYIDRAKSGTKDDRDQFLKMIEESKKGLFNGIVVYQLDRFARNRYDSATYKSKLKKNNVRVFSARENISEDASGVLMESVLEGMAEYFSLELGQKVKRGMGINAEKCYYNGGTVPLGFKLVEVDSDIVDAHGKVVKKQKYAIDEETAPIIRKVYEMYLDSYLMADIIRYLNKQQLKTAFGNDFNKNSIRKLLTNKKYMGVYSYNNIDTKGGIPNIVSDETWYKAQDTLNIKKQAPARARAKTEYLLTTKLFCGHCKDMMTGTSGTSSTGKLHTYYHCITAKKKIDCNKKNVQKDYLEDLVVNKARELLTDENIDRIARTVVDLAEKEKDTSNFKRLTKLLKEKEKQKENNFATLRLCEDDMIKKLLLEDISKIEKERIDLDNEIRFEEANFIKITIPQIKYFLTRLRNGDVNNQKYRKMLVSVLIYKIYLYDDEITIIFTSQDNKYEGKLPIIKELERSFNGTEALPYVNLVELRL